MAFDDVMTLAVTGTKHRAARRAGQDAVALDSSPRLCAAALSDGVGSFADSHHGARAAVAAAVRAALDTHANCADLTALARHAVCGAAQAVISEAGERGLPPHQLACTLAVLLIDERNAVIAAIGDGVQLVRYADGTLELLAMDGDKEIANFTDSLTTSDLAEATRFASVPVYDLDAVLLSSDGLDDVLCKGPTFARRPAASIVHGMLDSPRLEGWTAREFEAMLMGPPFSRVSDDDMSLVIAHARGTHEGTPVWLDRGGVAHAREHVSWPTGTRAHVLAERGGLKLVEVPHLDDAILAERVENPPVPIADSELAWPIDVGHTAALPPSLLVRPWGEAVPDLVAAFDQVRACVETLHDAGLAHGCLSDAHFAVDRYGTVQLRECISALSPQRLMERRTADQSFLGLLERRACVTR